MVDSDGGIQIAHPRGAGTFPLGGTLRAAAAVIRWSRGEEDAGLPARRLGLKDRGLLRAGMKADVVVFDPRTILDLSTARLPQARPAGIEHVFVNGVAVVEAGRPTAARPGLALRSLPRDVGHEQPLDRLAQGEMAGQDLVRSCRPRRRTRRCRDTTAA